MTTASTIATASAPRAHPRRPPVATVAALAAAALGMAVVLVLAAGRLDRAADTLRSDDQPVYLPRAEYLRPMSLGWQNVLADVLWFRTISYFGEHYRSDRTYPWLAQMCELVTDLDPRAEHVYRFAGVILPWEAHQSDAGIRLLEKGTRQFPDSWLLHYFAGFQYYFFRDDPERALFYLRRSMQLPGAHPTVAGLVAGLAAQQYGPDTTLEFFAELERNVDSPDVRNVLRERMLEVRLAAAAQQVDAAVAAYQQRTGSLPRNVDELIAAGLLSERPADPFGGVVVLDAESGKAKSSTGRSPSRLHQSRMRERALSGEPLRNP